MNEPASKAWAILALAEQARNSVFMRPGPVPAVPSARTRDHD